MGANHSRQSTSSMQQHAQMLNKQNGFEVTASTAMTASKTMPSVDRAADTQSLGSVDMEDLSILAPDNDTHGHDCRLNDVHLQLHMRKCSDSETEVGDSDAGQSFSSGIELQGLPNSISLTDLAQMSSVERAAVAGLHVQCGGGNSSPGPSVIFYTSE